MGNFTSCKIYVNKLNGKIELTELESKLQELQVKNNINQNIITYYSNKLNEFEIRFGAKWYPTVINEIFPNNEFEIWIISSDEGGWKDQIRYYYPNSSKEEFCNNAYYKLNKIRIKGNTERIYDKLEEIFGSGIQNAESKRINDGVEIKIECIYTSNNYFRNEYERKLVFEPFDDIPVSGTFGQETELWDLEWNVENIEFRERFYQEVINRPDGTTQFPFIESMEFLLDDTVTNIIEWNSNLTWSNWEHKAMNDYKNIVNKEYLKISTEGNKL